MTRNVRTRVTLIGILLVLLTSAVATSGNVALSAQEETTPAGACGSVVSADSVFAATTASQDKREGFESEEVEHFLVEAGGLASVIQTFVTDVPTIMVYRGEDVAQARRELEDSTSNDGARGLVDATRFVESCISEIELKEAFDAVATIPLREGEYISVGYSPYVDRIVIRSNTSAKDIEDTLSMVPMEQLAIGTDTRNTAARLTGGRLQDESGHWGGARIIASGGGSCSSYFSLIGPAGNRFSATAGHCPASDYVSGPHQFSSGTTAPNYPARDMRRLGRVTGQTFTNRSYSDANNSTNRPVVSSEDPINGHTYCNLGSYSKKICFIQTLTGQNYCDQIGCTTNLAYSSSITQALGQPGDSGGPVARVLVGSGDLGARGMVVAGGQIPGSAVYEFWYHVQSDVNATLGVTTLVVP